MAAMTTTARAAVVAVLLLQCFNVILAARPLLDATASGNGGGRWLGRLGGAGTLIMQVLSGGGPCPNQGWQGGNNAGCSP